MKQTNANKVFIHIRLKKETVENLKKYAAEKGWPTNIAVDTILQNYFLESNKLDG